MSKPVSFFSALAVFVSVSGTSSFLTHLSLSDRHHSAVYASAHGQEKSKNQIANSAVVSDSTMQAVSNTPPFVTDSAIPAEDIDLGETLILAHDIAAK